MVETQTVTRDALLNSLSWNSGGMSWGICAIGNMLAAKATYRILPSVVVVSMPQEQYTDDELLKLKDFSERMTEKHKRVCGEVLAGDNLICIGKDAHGWHHKRLTWEMGRMRSDTLDEALEFMAK